MNALGPDRVSVQLLDGSREAYRAVIEVLDGFMNLPPWPGVRDQQGLPDDWAWTMQVRVAGRLSWAPPPPPALRPPGVGTARAILRGADEDTRFVEEKIRDSFRTDVKSIQANSDGSVTRVLVVTPSREPV
ncbi:hypothetical protein ACFU51_04260 [Streptomyces sp. NPDC057430]|uniref:hypothetical protein n=1 Tax=Streptomyces sp. NPDC057430 TaxID=3346131 RepID=UPI0036C6787F